MKGFTESFAGLRKNWAYDLPAAVVVFLVALPLCLGIALASDAPLFSGVLAGVVGGVLVGALSGSQLSVSGPAAGLTVIVASGIGQLGSFEVFLTAVVLSGLFQIVFSILRGGFLANLFPNSVIKGMLAAIGITIILKQIPHALGAYGQFESDMGFWDEFGSGHMVHALMAAVRAVNLLAVLICALALAILIGWDHPVIKKNQWLSKLPGPLVATVVAAVTNLLFQLNFPDLALRAEDGHLVALPILDSWSAFVGELRFPDFSALLVPGVWTVGLAIAAVGSIETLLCIESTDKLDPLRRVSNTNRELFAQGTGNLVSGLIGGIPITSVIVRSSANIYAGARTRGATIMHGLILLVSAISLGSVLNLIPVAALAAVLFAVGYKLAHPKVFKAVYAEGFNQFLPFVSTVLAILLTDLLTGVAIGFVVGLVFVVKATYYSALLVVKERHRVLIRFTKDVTFIHKMKLRAVLASIEPNAHVLLDGSRAMFIDHDVLEMIAQFVDTAEDRNIRVELLDVGLRTVPMFSQRLNQAKKRSTA